MLTWKWSFIKKQKCLLWHRKGKLEGKGGGCSNAIYTLKLKSCFEEFKYSFCWKIEEKKTGEWSEPAKIQISHRTPLPPTKKTWDPYQTNLKGVWTIITSDSKKNTWQSPHILKLKFCWMLKDLNWLWHRWLVSWVLCGCVYIGQSSTLLCCRFYIGQDWFHGRCMGVSTSFNHPHFCVVGSTLAVTLARIGSMVGV